LVDVGDGTTRVERLAELLIGRSLEVQQGWQVLVTAGLPSRSLVEALVAAIARRGAYPLVRLTPVDLDPFPFATAWARAAPVDLLESLPPAEAHLRDTLDARVIVFAPENVADGSELAPERRTALRRAAAPFQRRLSERPWVSCPFPTNALAQDAGLTLEQYEDVLFAACLRDWDAEGERMRRLAARFDEAETVRVVGAGTDVSLSVAGRTFVVDDGHRNMPGGEFFTSPVEGSAEGVIEFAEYATTLSGNRCEGIRLRFEAGRVADASARVGETFLHAALDTDDGARVLGELGIGCNRGIPRHVRQMWFDEKVDGTVHLALGQGFPECGGTNVSALHWDLVKDLAQGRIELDGEVVQQDGAWLSR
jgi:aminopeptidase